MHSRKEHKFLIGLKKIAGGEPGAPHPEGPEMEFHISRKARDQYGFEESLFRLSGNVVFANFAALRQFAGQLQGGKARAGELNAMGLIDEIFHFVVALYRKEQNPNMLTNVMAHLEKELGRNNVEKTLRRFAEEFPPTSVYRKEKTLDEYIDGRSGGIPHRLVLLEELLMLWMSNQNPGFGPYRKDLFDDSELTKKTDYKKITGLLQDFFKTQPPFGPYQQDLLTMLRSPAITFPDSLTGQLKYIREHWGFLIGDFLSRLLTSLDFIKEEEKFGGHGPGETLVYDFSGVPGLEEYESFTPDRHWMPRLVLMAKSTHVWLDQLSKKYNRDITRLDQVPDEELDTLARRGFTGLWLIGLWERSPASQRIKQMCGNPEAMASAYSIFEYRIADDIGGEDAMNNLKHRAWQRGIRMASDMVPNHMGIDSPWLVEHPDWFLSLNYCPYPSYTFNGPDLSADSRVGIFLEDHYYDRTDAAVVFKWVNNHTGEVRYIYHGNDGTSMPWNDTAQLNYLNPEVRDAVMGTMLSVANRFPVIRFDAAMTLSKKHYQRLWFPEPGGGGDIPTRSEHGIPFNDFNEKMPQEFWRQVVDRFSEQHDDTLLLAEAFWLMEAYFVRTLGMHRVYNSAFMNFLKNEDNAQFRMSIKNTLQFNPQILKRFVNFMNNPDEETAAAQFGKDDKYFGITTLMATLPGLPMFGHGQIEGFAEKYGMEYRCAYWDETPDQYLIQRHEREIFPLLRKRYLFADVESFLLYDFYTVGGWVNEDVIAYSNRFGDERCLVVVHNKFAETSGWIKTSVPFIVKTDTGDEHYQKDLGEGMSLTPGDGRFTIFRDHASGLEYIRRIDEIVERGLFIELQAFKKNVFLDFREVADDQHRVYSRLHDMLNGKGVKSIDDTLRKHFRNPLAAPFSQIVNPELFGELEAAMDSESKKDAEKVTAVVEKNLELFFQAVRRLTGGPGDTAAIAADTCKILKRFLTLPHLEMHWTRHHKDQPQACRAMRRLVREIAKHPINKPVLFTWILLHKLPEISGSKEPGHTWELMKEWLLKDQMTHTLEAMEFTPQNILDATALFKILIVYLDTEWWNMLDKAEDHDTLAAVHQRLEDLFDDRRFKNLCHVNWHDEILWFKKEPAEEFINRLMVAVFPLLPVAEDLWSTNHTCVECTMVKHRKRIQLLLNAVRLSGYQWDELLSLVKEGTGPLTGTSPLEETG